MYTLDVRACDRTQRQAFHRVSKVPMLKMVPIQNALKAWTVDLTLPTPLLFENHGVSSHARFSGHPLFCQAWIRSDLLCLKEYRGLRSILLF